MPGSEYHLTDDDVRYIRELASKVEAIELQSQRGLSPGSVIEYKPPCRSAFWSDSRAEAVSNLWSYWYQLNDFGTAAVEDASREVAKRGLLTAAAPAFLPLLAQPGGLSSDGGYSVYFPGEEKSRIELPLLFSIARGWTMETIFKAQTLPQQALIVYNGNELVNGFGIGIQESELLLRSPGGASVETGVALTAEQWYDVIFIANSSDNKLYWFVSTITPLTKAFTITTGSAVQPTAVVPTTRAAIGARGPSGELPFKGWVSEVSAWNAQLSGSEVLRSAYDRLRTSLEPSAPQGFAKADGIAVSRSKFASLFRMIGTKEGAGDGVRTFNLPNKASSIVRV